MRLDLRVTSATPFVVANNVVNVKLSPDLRLSGTGELPELRGTIAIEPSRVLLPSGTLRIRSGRIEFRLDQPDVPVLDIQAKTLLQGYDIEILVSGPYDNPRVDVSSVPPLPREDLVLLVLTGRPPTTGLTQGTGTVAAVDVAVYIARDVAAAWLEGESEVSEDESLAERIEVIVGAETTKSGVDAVLVRMRLAGKPGERGSGLYVTGERDTYDFYNYGLRLVFTFQ
jgi:translocation and assembly module TamB